MNQISDPRGFIGPVVITYKDESGEIASEYGNYVVINPDGWIVTARHVIDFPEGQIINDWYGIKDIKLTDIHKGNNDLAIARFEPFDSSITPQYPIFGNPKQLVENLTLSHVGYVIPKDFDESKADIDAMGNKQYPGEFISKNVRFNEVIFAKDPNDKEGKFSGQFIETKGNAIKGQSGGALIDQSGIVYGIVSHTSQYPDQIVGRSIPADIIIKFFDMIGIEYQSKK